MATRSKRFMISVSSELEQKIYLLKKRKFCNKSYAEMYRQLISAGMNELEKREAERSGAER